MKPRDVIHESIDALAIGLIVVQGDGAVVRVNRRASEILGLEPDLPPKTRLEHILESAGPLAEKCLSTGVSGNQKVRINGGDELNLEINPILDEDGVTGAVCCLMPNRNPHSPSDEFYNTLDSQELNAIFELSSDGILLCDGNGVVIKINDASAKLNGWSADEVVGKNVRDLIQGRLIDRSVTLEVLETGRQVNMMQYITRTQKHILVTGTPLFDEQGDVKLVVVNERDLTQLNSIQLQLEETRKMSEKYRDELAELALLKSQVGDFVAESQEMRQVLKYALKLARLDASNILLLGESGTGKGLLAKFIHESGERGGPMIQINCAALPEALLEAELFGYEMGAFTGAKKTGKAGLFELAQNGTLLLDEIGDCPISIQAKLLKYLDDHEVLRLGSVKPRIIDCNIIAATNRDLEELIEKGAFRSDFFYRLNTFTIHIPPLRERPEDAFELIMHFLDEFNSRYGLKRKISSKALQHLQNCRFSGNVRELKSIIKQAVVMSENDVLDDFILEGLDDKQRRPRTIRAVPMGGERLGDQVRRFEKDLLRKVIPRCRTTREMARHLGVSQPTVVRRLKKYGLLPPSKQG